MAIINSFRAVRPKGELASKVAALPYDVMNEVEAREMIKDNPYSFLNIDRSEVNFQIGTDPHSIIVYNKAAELLKKFMNDGIFIKEENPCLYIYKLKMDGRSQVGLVASTSVDDYINGIIKKHEFTREDKEQDRINHVNYCNANTGPIFLAYRDNQSVISILEDWINNNLPIYDFVSDDNIGHTVWVIDSDDVISKILMEFQNIDSLYIADGHHRAASAVAVANKRREENKNFTGLEEFNYFLSVIFPASHLKIMENNRLILDLNGLTEEEFLEEINKSFILTLYEGEDSFSPRKQHEFGLFLKNQWYILTARPEIIPNDIVGRLDASILQNNILSPILGIEDPRTNNRIDFLGGIRGLIELEDKVKTGQARLAFSMFPTSMEELMSVADSNNVMPPKSTWFEPKLRSGLFIHELE